KPSAPPISGWLLPPCLPRWWYQRPHPRTGHLRPLVGCLTMPPFPPLIRNFGLISRRSLSPSGSIGGSSPLLISALARESDVYRPAIVSPPPRTTGPSP